MRRLLVAVAALCIPLFGGCTVYQVQARQAEEGKAWIKKSSGVWTAAPGGFSSDVWYCTGDKKKAQCKKVLEKE
ncbi:MAG: hypothetical protein VX223_10710 [Myxococcota bacterium]|nr:hypothetical protein [Myxococcota bacterium]